MSAAPGAPPILEVRDATHAYGSRTVLSGVDLTEFRRRQGTILVFLT